LHSTHVLVQHTNSDFNLNSKILVPRVVGCSIPRSTSTDDYVIFMLSHFKPWSNTDPLLPAESSYIDAFTSYNFSPKSLDIISNWEAVHECEDACDAEQLKKCAALSCEARTLTKALNGMFPGDDGEDHVNLDVCQTNAAKKELELMQAVLKLKQYEWFAQCSKSYAAHAPSADIPDPTSSMLKDWKKATQQQEAVISSARRNALNPSTATASSVITEDSIDDSNSLDGHRINAESVHATENPTSQGILQSSGNILDKVEHEYSLNHKQHIAFWIAASKFIQDHQAHLHRVSSQDDSQSLGPGFQTVPPMRMFMTGPGGTGKTHVVKALHAVMAAHGCKHQIQFLAPTGSAAALIDGMTIHKGLGITIVANIKGKGNCKPGEHIEDYSVAINVKNKSHLREEWENVDFLLIDEVSLLSEQLLSEIDHALRYAKEKTDEWFRGINFILAGEFYQYPPVGGSPLYEPIGQSTKINDDNLKKTSRSFSLENNKCCDKCN
jgi:hypothetical protein